jgi:hypothetical protein
VAAVSTKSSRAAPTVLTLRGRSARSPVLNTVTVRAGLGTPVAARGTSRPTASPRSRSRGVEEHRDAVGSEVGDAVGKANSKGVAHDRTVAAGLRSNGRVIGRVTLSVQGDIGYIKLMGGFTERRCCCGPQRDRFPAAASRRDPPPCDQRRSDLRWPALSAPVVCGSRIPSGRCGSRCWSRGTWPS